MNDDLTLDTLIEILVDYRKRSGKDMTVFLSAQGATMLLPIRNALPFTNKETGDEGILVFHDPKPVYQRMSIQEILGETEEAVEDVPDSEPEEPEAIKGNGLDTDALEMDDSERGTIARQFLDGDPVDGG